MAQSASILLWGPGYKELESCERGPNTLPGVHAKEFRSCNPTQRCTHRHTLSNAHTDTHSETHTQAHSDAHANTHWDAHTLRHAHTDTLRCAYTDTLRDAHTGTHL